MAKVVDINKEVMLPINIPIMGYAVVTGYTDTETQNEIEEEHGDCVVGNIIYRYGQGKRFVMLGENFDVGDYDALLEVKLLPPGTHIEI